MINSLKIMFYVGFQCISNNHIIVFCILTVILGFFAVLYAFSNMDFGLMGGDCVESASYENLYFDGNITGTNSGSISIHIGKPEGICPQSVAVDRIVAPDVNGIFSEQIPHHIGDDAITITIFADGYEISELAFQIQARFDLDLSIQANEIVVIQGTETSYVRRLNEPDQYPYYLTQVSSTVDRDYCSQD